MVKFVARTAKNPNHVPGERRSSTLSRGVPSMTTTRVLFALAAVTIASADARAAEAPASRRIGAIEVAKAPDFDVLADSRRNTIHFAWRDQQTINYVASK